MSRKLDATGPAVKGPDVRCETGKRIYFKERAANKAITRALERGELGPLRHYQCDACGYWHLSRKKPARPYKSFVPLSIRSRSRLVSWLWLHTPIGYDRARVVARWLP